MQESRDAEESGEEAWREDFKDMTATATAAFPDAQNTGAITRHECVGDAICFKASWRAPSTQTAVPAPETVMTEADVPRMPKLAGYNQFMTLPPPGEFDPQPHEADLCYHPVCHQVTNALGRTWVCQTCLWKLGLRYDGRKCLDLTKKKSEKPS